MNRDKLISLVEPQNGRGLEIGPLDSPIVTRDMGRVEYIDRATREELQHGYGRSDAVKAEAIVQVDHVWGDQTLFECVGGRRAYDYLVASHVIEHVPDLFGWLQEIAAVLTDGGRAVFVVPDKRYTFDMRRRTSSPAELIEAHLDRRRRPSVRQVFDCFHNYRSLSGPRADADTPDGGTSERTLELYELCRRMTSDGDYVDAHCWVFTPRSLAEALDLGSLLGLLPFAVERLAPTEPGDYDFPLVLRRLPDTLGREAARAAFLASYERLDLPEQTETDGSDTALLAKAHIALGRLSAIEQSTSWMITAPLRKAVTTLRKLSARGRRGAVG